MSKKYIQDKSTNKRYRYLTKEELNERYKESTYKVAGELNPKDERKKEHVKITRQGEEIYHFPIGTYDEKRYKTLGYIECERDEYISVKKRRTPIALILAVLLILCLLAGGIYMINKNNSQIDPAIKDYTSNLKRPENIDSTKILIPGFSKFTVEKGSKTIDTTLFNPEGNPCHFQFTLVEKETGKVLYESKLVPPGKGIGPIEIKKSYDKVGTYPAILKFKTVDFEDTDITYNGSEVEVDINVVE